MQGTLIYKALMNMPYYVWHDPTYPFVIPAINWEVMSHEQRVQWLTCNIAGLIEYANKQTDSINVLNADLEKLANEFEQFKANGFNEYYEKQVADWINANLDYIFKETVKQVYFGLTNDGHFVAYVPDSWSDIKFDTGYDYNLNTYGRLILRWNVSEDALNVTQTPIENNRFGIVEV